MFICLDLQTLMLNVNFVILKKKQLKKEMLNCFCQCTKGFWRKIENYFTLQTNHELHLDAKDVLFYYEDNSKDIQYIVNLIVLFHVSSFTFMKPSSPNLLLLLLSFILIFQKNVESVETNTNPNKTVRILQELFKDLQMPCLKVSPFMFYLNVIKSLHHKLLCLECNLRLHSI